MFRQNRQPSPAEAHAQRIEQRAISGQAYEQQRVESDPYAPTPRSRLDSYRAQQGQPIGQQEQQPPADALTPRRRLDSFRQQQGQPVAAAAPMNGGLASPPSVPGLGLGRMSDAGQLGGGGSLNTDRGVPLSTRRLKKEVPRATLYPNPNPDPNPDPKPGPNPNPRPVRCCVPTRATLSCPTKWQGA